MSTASQSPTSSPRFEDRILYCKDCREPFVFTASEQRFFQSQGFQNDPKRCRECRHKRNGERGGRR